jgi:uncharacterized protein YerC
MNVEIAIPDNINRKIRRVWPNVSQRAREALAVEAYRADILTEAEVQQMLGLATRWEVDAFLKRANAYSDYTEEDLRRDIETIRSLRSSS